MESTEEGRQETAPLFCASSVASIPKIFKTQRRKAAKDAKKGLKPKNHGKHGRPREKQFLKKGLPVYSLSVGPVFLLLSLLLCVLCRFASLRFKDFDSFPRANGIMRERNSGD
jgi:hypothetical protein